MPRRAQSSPLQASRRRVAGRFPAAIGAGLLLVAVATSACSPSASSPGRSLPTSVSASIGHLRSTRCTLNASGTQVVATGRISPPAALPVVGGQQVGALQLQVSVLTSKTVFGHHHVEVGDNDEGVSVGQTTWHLVAPIEQVDDLKPTRCVVTYGDFG